MIKIYALGGSGENGRNCYAVEYAGDIVLFDCGVKREIHQAGVGFYPELTVEIAKKIKAVFLSHVHEDHSAALPLLYQLGYRGKIYATAATIAALPSFLTKWMNFVSDNNGEIPYSLDAVQQLVLQEISCGINQINGLTVEVGRSGHVIGGIWFIVTVGGKRIFYSGDMVLAPMSLQVDLPTSCDVAILNCAYAGKTLNSASQNKQLVDAIKATLLSGGKVILPLPPKGRGADIFLYITKWFANENIFVDQEICDSGKTLAAAVKWISQLDQKVVTENYDVIINNEQRRIICDSPLCGIILTQDGMLTADEGQYYYRLLQNDSRNKIIFTGHTASGTLGDLLMDDQYCAANAVKIQRQKIVFKVHLDDDDVMMLQNHLHAKQIILFHAPQENMQLIIERLQAKGVKAGCSSLKNVWHVL